MERWLVPTFNIVSESWRQLQEYSKGLGTKAQLWGPTPANRRMWSGGSFLSNTVIHLIGFSIFSFNLLYFLVAWF